MVIKKYSILKVFFNYKFVWKKNEMKKAKNGPILKIQVVFLIEKKLMVINFEEKYLNLVISIICRKY